MASELRLKDVNLLRLGVGFLNVFRLWKAIHFVSSLRGKAPYKWQFRKLFQKVYAFAHIFLILIVEVTDNPPLRMNM